MGSFASSAVKLTERQNAGRDDRGPGSVAPLPAERTATKSCRRSGSHGVLRFPRQEPDRRAAEATSARSWATSRSTSPAPTRSPAIPEVMILSNIVENGKPIGLSDAGQDWHTDMSYSRQIAFANVLYGIKIPRRDGKAARQHRVLQHARGLRRPARPTEEDARRQDGAARLQQVLGDDARREGSRRPPLTEAQSKAKPPVSHPIFLTHPITGRKVLYANPGYSMRINELPEKESDETLGVPLRAPDAGPSTATPSSGRKATC